MRKGGVFLSNARISFPGEGVGTFFVGMGLEAVPRPRFSKNSVRKRLFLNHLSLMEFPSAGKNHRKSSLLQRYSYAGPGVSKGIGPQRETHYTWLSCLWLLTFVPDQVHKSPL